MIGLLDIDESFRHISRQFDEDLQNVHRKILIMGQLVTEQLMLGINAQKKHDAKLCAQVISGSGEVISLQEAADEACLRILARRHPTARDLRLVMAMGKTIAELEHMGNEIQQIASRTLLLSEQNPKQVQLRDLEHLALRVNTRLRDALEAFAYMDKNLALKVLRASKKIDKEYEGILRQQITHMMGNPQSTPACLSILCSARSLEIINVGTANVCRYVLYYVSSKNFCHIPWEEVVNTLR